MIEPALALLPVVIALLVGLGTAAYLRGHPPRGHPPDADESPVDPFHMEERMAIYYGVVHNGRVELEDDARLAEGTRVEVRPQGSTNVTGEDDAVKERLRAAGLLAPASVAAPGDEDEDDAFEPVVMQGELLSAQVIRERR